MARPMQTYCSLLEGISEDVKNACLPNPEREAFARALFPNGSAAHLASGTVVRIPSPWDLYVYIVNETRGPVVSFVQFNSKSGKARAGVIWSSTTTSASRLAAVPTWFATAKQHAMRLRPERLPQLYAAQQQAELARKQLASIGSLLIV